MSAAVLYALVAAAALGLAHRLIRPMRRRTAALLALMPLLFTGQALVTGGVYAPIDLAFMAPPLDAEAARYGIEGVHNGVLADIYTQMIPWKKVAREAWLSGQWPLWNPYVFAGDILAASAQPAVWEPLFLLSLVLPFAASLTFLATAQLFAAALAMFLFLRELELREQAALFGAAAWTFGDALVLWLEWPLGASWRLLPLVLLAVRLAARAAVSSPRPATLRTPAGAVALLALSLAFTILQGHPETVLHVVTIASVWGLWELSALPDRRGRALARCVAGGILGALLSSVFLLPVLEAVPQTIQHHYRTEYYRGERKSLHLAEASEHLLSNFIPFRYGSAREGERAGGVELEATPNKAYAGLLLFPLAALGAIRARARERWLLIAFVLAGWIFGSKIPPFPDLLGSVPLFDLALNDRLTAVAIFGLAALAALGVDEWLRSGSDRAVHRSVAAAVVLAALAVGAWTPAMIRSGLSAAFLVRETVVFLVPAAAAAVALRFAPTRRAAFAILMLALLSSRTLEVGNEYPTLPARAFYPPFEGLELFPKEDPPYRITAVGYALIPQTAAMYGLEDVRGYQAMTNGRLWQTMPFWSEFQLVSFNVVTDLTWPFLSFLNVRYAIAPPSAEPPGGWRIAGEARAMRLMENERVLPRAFVPALVRINTPEGRLLEEMGAERDFGQRAWITHFGGGAVEGEIPNGPGSATTTRSGLGRLQISASMEGPGWLVVSETNWKGWRAYRGGRRIPIRNANHAFVGMYLEAGRHEIDLVYRPRSFVWGLGISLAAALCIMALLVLANRGDSARSGPRARGEDAAAC